MYVIYELNNEIEIKVSQKDEFDGSIFLNDQGYPYFIKIENIIDKGTLEELKQKHAEYFI